MFVTFFLYRLYAILYYVHATSPLLKSWRIGARVLVAVGRQISASRSSPMNYIIIDDAGSRSLRAAEPRRLMSF